MEVASEVRMEGSMLFPRAAELMERVRHCEAGRQSTPEGFANCER